VCYQLKETWQDWRGKYKGDTSSEEGGLGATNNKREIHVQSTAGKWRVLIS